MKKIIILIAVISLFSPFAFGQKKKTAQSKSQKSKKKPIVSVMPSVRLPGPNDQPVAAGLPILRQANSALGGTALDNLKTLRLTGKMRIENNFYDRKILVDTTLDRVREETTGKSGYFYVLQVEKNAGWSFAAGQRRESSADEANDLRKTLETGFLGLRSSRLEKLTISLIEIDKAQELKKLRVYINGNLSEWVFNFDDLLVSERPMPFGGANAPDERFDLFDDYRLIDGIKIPHRTATRLGELLITSDWSAVEVNPSFTEKDWAVPQR